MSRIILSNPVTITNLRKDVIDAIENIRNTRNANRDIVVADYDHSIISRFMNLSFKEAREWNTYTHEVKRLVIGHTQVHGGVWYGIGLSEELKDINKAITKYYNLGDSVEVSIELLNDIDSALGTDKDDHDE